MKVHAIWIAAFTLIWANGIGAQNRTFKAGQIRLERVGEFKQNHLEDISADGKHALFYQTSIPIRTFTFPLDGRKPTANQVPIYDDILRVVQFPNGREVSRVRTNFFPYYAKFLGTAEVFYSETDAATASVVDKIWNFGTNKVEITLDRNKIGLGDGEFLGDFWIISREKAVATIPQRESSPILVSISLTKNAIMRIGRLGPNVPKDEYAGQIRSMAISPRRDQIAFRTRGGVLVIRDADDLNRGRDVASPNDLAFERVIYTPDGKNLVVFADTRSPNESGFKNYLLFFDTKSFEIVRRLDITSWDPSLLRDVNSNYVLVRSDAMAISPDGKTIAIGQTRTVRKMLSTTEQAEVVLYDLTTGFEICRVRHPAVKENRNDPFVAKLGKIMFTPDGEYLMTSTHDTLVWKIFN